MNKFIWTMISLFLAAPICASGAIIPEFYTDQSAFEARLGGVTVIDFDDVDTATVDPAPFNADRYEASHGAVITGELGQFASNSFGFPIDYPPVSGTNVYAPGPTASPDGGPTDGGNFTNVTFSVGGQSGLVAGVGAYFIDTDFPNIGQSSLAIFDAQGAQIGIDNTFSGPNGSQLFIGIVAVDDGTNLPVPVIASAELINGSGWPTLDSGEGVVIDDLQYGQLTAIPEPNSLILLGCFLTLCGCRLTLPRHRIYP